MSISLKRIEWENKPSKKTPLNKLNLEKMEQNTEDAVNEVDSKVNVLEQDNIENKQDISDIKTKNTEQDTKLNTLETDNTTNKQNIINLQNSDNTINDNMKAKDVEIAKLKSDLEKMEQNTEDTTKNYLRKSEDIVVILHYVAEKNDVDTIEYPKNFNMHNTVVLSVIEDANKGEYWKTADFHNDGIALTHHLASVELHSTNIKIQGNRDTYYRITLMRF